MPLTHNTQYVAIGLSRLLMMYKGKPRIEALIASWLDEFQAVEDAQWDVWFNRVLQHGPTGDLLAKIGKLVGQGSEGLPDDLYRRLIMARIKANRSNGKREELITILKLLAPNTPIYMKDIPAAALYAELQGAIELPPLLVGRSFLGVAVVAGVLLMFVWSQQPLTNTFRFGSVNGAVPVPTASQSFGSVNVAVPPGGVLSGVVQILGGP